MKRFEQRISQTPPFGNTNITAAQIPVAGAITVNLTEFSFYGCCAHHSTLMDLFLAYIPYLKV
jgi:hypothetical protein